MGLRSRAARRTGISTAIVVAVVLGASGLAAAASLGAVTSQSVFSQTTSISPQPPTPGDVFYLHNNPTPPVGDTNSQRILPFDSTAPSATVLYNYDQDRDDEPGRLLAKSGEGLRETDPTKFQIWSMGGPVDIDGTVTLTLWAAMKDFDTTKRGVVRVALMDCRRNGRGCTRIATASVNSAPWDSAGIGTWAEKTIDFGTVTHSVAANRTLRIKIVVGNNSDDDMWFAYDTASYDSNLRVIP